MLPLERERHKGKSFDFSFLPVALSSEAGTMRHTFSVQCICCVGKYIQLVGVEPRASSTRGKHCSPELVPSPSITVITTVAEVMCL